MRKWFGFRPNAPRLDVSIGRGPLPKVETATPSKVRRGRSVRNPRPPSPASSWLRWLVIAIVAAAAVTGMRLLLAWIESR